MKNKSTHNRVSFFSIAVFSLFSLGSLHADQLVSKGTGLITAVGETIWVFDGNNQNFSRIQFFSDPVDIRNTQRKKGVFLSGGIGISSGVLGHSIAHNGDNIWEIGFHHIQTDKDEQLFDFRFKIDFGLVQDFESGSTDTLGGALSAIVGTDIIETDSLFVFGLKTGGITFLPKNKNTGLPDFGSDIKISLFTSKGYLVDTLICTSDTLCDLKVFEDIHDKALGAIRSVDAVGFLPQINSPGLLLIGSSFEGKGLRIGELGADSLAPVTSAGLDTLPISDIFIHPANHSIWVFTNKRVFLSLDSGKTFTEPSKPHKIHPDIVTNLQTPALAFKGDSTYINFDFPTRPGIVAFSSDSLLTNKNSGEEEYEHYLIPGLQISEDILLGQMCVAAKDDQRVLVVGTQNRGVYFTAFKEGVWQHINRQRELQGNLKEVITFPTVFDGSQEVQIGYRLKKSGRVTIKVFNYAMEPVVTLVRNKPRQGGGNRSEILSEDKWDGTDKFGQNVSTGVYYIQIKSDKGERGWGKVMVVGGQE